MSRITPPQLRPHEFGFKHGDTHLVVNPVTDTCKAYAFNGSLLWGVPALTDGQHPNWRLYQGDTPPGLYRLGTVYDDYGEDPSPAYNRTAASYGWMTFDMVDLEGNEDRNGRSGICLHGGGSGLGWPGAWLPHQKLLPTWGCIRMHNSDLRNRVYPLYKQGVVFLSVHQDDQ